MLLGYAGYPPLALTRRSVFLGEKGMRLRGHAGYAPLEAVCPQRLAGICPRGRNVTLGQATLSFILLVSGVILEVAIAGSFVAYFFSASGYGERVSARALAAARAGFEDAQIQIARNKEYGGGSTVQYSFSVGDDTVTVTVTRTTVDANTYRYRITAVGTAFTRERRLAGVMTVDRTTGVARLESFGEEAVD